MADIFGYNRGGPADVFVADNSKFSITGIDGGTDLIQNWQITYQQNIQPIYEIGSPKLYWAKGNPIGRGVIGRIVGNNFLLFASNLCDKGQRVTITNAAGACSGGGVTLACIGSICTSIGFSAQAGNPTVAESLEFQFSSLEVNNGAGGGGGSSGSSDSSGGGGFTSGRGGGNGIG